MEGQLQDEKKNGSLWRPKPEESPCLLPRGFWMLVNRNGSHSSLSGKLLSVCRNLSPLLSANISPKSRDSFLSFSCFLFFFSFYSPFEISFTFHFSPFHSVRYIYCLITRYYATRHVQGRVISPVGPTESLLATGKWRKLACCGRVI